MDLLCRHLFGKSYMISKMISHVISSKISSENKDRQHGTAIYGT
jgi:hypothetical protein